LPHLTFRVRHLDLDRVAREGVTESRHESADLDAAVDRIHDVAVITPQHTALIADPDLRGPLADAVHQA